RATEALSLPPAQTHRSGKSAGIENLRAGHACAPLPVYSAARMMPHSLISRPDRSPLVAPGEIEHLVEDMTVIASADLSLATLQARLATTSQWLPVDGDAAMTLGQLITLNSTGPLRLGYGAWRDLLLGVQFRNRRGELITAGGKTV